MAARVDFDFSIVSPIILLLLTLAIPAIMHSNIGKWYIDHPSKSEKRNFKGRNGRKTRRRRLWTFTQGRYSKYQTKNHENRAKPDQETAETAAMDSYNWSQNLMTKILSHPILIGQLKSTMTHSKSDFKIWGNFAKVTITAIHFLLFNFHLWFNFCLWAKLEIQNLPNYLKTATYHLVFIVANMPKYYIDFLCIATNRTQFYISLLVEILMDLLQKKDLL